MEKEGERVKERKKGERRHCVIKKGKLPTQHKIYVQTDASFQNFPLSVHRNFVKLET
jgi:hypothetical protein